MVNKYEIGDIVRCRFFLNPDRTGTVVNIKRKLFNILRYVVKFDDGKIDRFYASDMTLIESIFEKRRKERKRIEALIALEKKREKELEKQRTLLEKLKQRELKKLQHITEDPFGEEFW